MAKDPNEIVQARRIAPWTVSNVDFGEIKQGDVIPMRRQEAEERDDFEIVDGKAASKDAPASTALEPKEAVQGG